MQYSEQAFSVTSRVNDAGAVDDDGALVDGKEVLPCLDSESARRVTMPRKSPLSSPS